jgi:hypothetical protein
VTALPARLRPDCAQCSGLCCVAPPFDADQGFGHDKAAHEPCRHLAPDFRCRIHGRLLENGYPGCASFDCFGAGQRVTQQLFGGRNWSRNPEIAARMFDTYARVRSLHELMAMATLAQDHVTSEAGQLALQELIAEIDARANRTCRSITQLRREVMQRLRHWSDTRPTTSAPAAHWYLLGPSRCACEAIIVCALQLTISQSAQQRPPTGERPPVVEQYFNGRHGHPPRIRRPSSIIARSTISGRAMSARRSAKQAIRNSRPIARQAAP